MAAPAWWSDTLEQTLLAVGSCPEGLSGEQASARLRTSGPNVLIDTYRLSVLLALLVRLANPLIVILLVASLVSGLSGQVASFCIIVTMVLLSVSLDLLQEHRAQRAALALRDSVAPLARVLRDGVLTRVLVARLVPGDVVEVSAGSLVPADGRLLASKDLFVNQGLLTGEAFPVEKSPRGLSTGDAELASASHVLFMGTSVVSGSGRFVVVRTGRETMLGEIAGLLEKAPPPTAFELGVRRFGLLIMRLTVLLVLFVLLVNATLQRPWLESFLFALALAVGLTPEMLPMIVTVTLARGAQVMAREKVIVKQLASIENLGSMDVLCTDKTGTLTEGAIRLERHIDPLGVESPEPLLLAYINSSLESGLRSPLDDAILAHEQLDISAYQKLDEVPFDFERRMVSVLVQGPLGRRLIVKGAPEDLLDRSVACDTHQGQEPLDDDRRERLDSLRHALEDDGFRVLGVAWRPEPDTQVSALAEDEASLLFAGYCAFYDPPKAGAGTTLRRLAEVGVAVKIVTGDSERVARYICRSLGVAVEETLHGDDIDDLDADALSARADAATLFCRVKPAQKGRILAALKRRGHVVGFLGDGINDAPALHVADVGISVDTAVDVARDAAHMILLERDLGVLLDGVLEGRRTFGNVMKYILMGTSSNFGNVFSMAGAAGFLPFLPMLPTQVLLNNLLFDFSEMAVPLDEVDPEELRYPRQLDTRLIERFMAVIGPVSSIFDFATFALLLKVFGADAVLFHTGWFLESLITQVLVIFVIRTRRSPLESRPHPLLAATSLLVVVVGLLLPYSPLSEALGFVAPPPAFLLMLAGLVVTYLALVEGVKRWFYRRYEPREERGPPAGS
jgi:P-type Mg2+ transporter